MGYTIELLYKEHNKNFHLIGDSNNYIPYFWGLIFYKNKYKICFDHDTECITLTLELKNSNYPNVNFSNETLSCWNDFIATIKHFEDKGTLYLELGTILSMDYDYTELLVEDKLVDAITDLLRESVVSNRSDYKYIDLLGTSTFENLDESKYETLKPTVSKKDFHKSDRRSVLKMIPMFFLCIFFTFYGIYELFNAHLVLGIFSVLLFGIGGAFYFWVKLKE